MLGYLAERGLSPYMESKIQEQREVSKGKLYGYLIQMRAISFEQSRSNQFIEGQIMSHSLFKRIFHINLETKISMDSFEATNKEVHLMSDMQRR